MTRQDFVTSLFAFSLYQEPEKENAYSHSPSWLGDIFPDISRHLKTLLICYDRDFVAGEYVFIHTNHKDKDFIQKSLVNLFSYRPYRWRWEETKEGNRLQAPRGSIVDKKELDKKILEDFSEYLEDLVENINDEKIKSTFPGADPIEIDRRKLVLNILKEAIPDKETRKKLVMEQGKLIIPLESASDKIKNFAKEQIDTAIAKGFVPSRPSQHVLFNVSISPIKSTPSLSFQVDPIGGSTYAGGRTYESRFQETMEAGWFSTEDSRTHEKDKLILPKSGEDALQMLGETVGNVFFRLPYVVKEPGAVVGMGFGNKVYKLTSGVFPPEMAAGKTVGEFRRSLREEYPGGRICSKWRGDTLFLTYPAWVRPQPYLPWEAIRLLLAAKKEKRDLTVAEMLEICAKTGKYALSCLEDEFPVAKSLADWRDLLGPPGAQPALRKVMQQPSGMTWEAAEARLLFPPLIAFEVSRVSAQRIRLRLSDEAPRGQRVGIELLNGQRQVLATIYLNEPA